jgi:tetratricopeptide (TPR) repeat protein
MRRSQRRAGLRRLCRHACWTLAVTLPVLTHAAGEVVELAPASPALIAEALDLDQAARTREGARRDPDSLVLYIGSRAELLLHEVLVQIDSQPPVRYRYSDVEAAALHSGSLHRLIVASLPAGNHQLRAQAVAREFDAKPDEPGVRGQIIANFRTAGAGSFEMDFEKGGYFSGDATLSLRELRPDGAEDPRVRASGVLLAQGRYFEAASDLLQLQPGPQAGAYYLRLSEALSGMGLIERGQAIRSRIESRIGAPASSQAANLNADYAVALALIESGHADEGYSALGHLGSGGAIMARAALDRANFTLGYQLLGQRQGDKAVEAFERVHSPGPYGNGALLGMGWALLDQARLSDRKQDARPVLNEAAARARPHFASDIAQMRYPASQGNSAPRTPRRWYDLFDIFGTDSLGKDQQAALKRALVPWEVLIGRDPLDPAVQEGLLAVAWALDSLGAHQDAMAFYQRAIRLLEQDRRQLDAARQQVDSHGLAATLLARDSERASGWHWSLVDLPFETETAYLRQLIADARFYASAQRFLDLTRLGSALDQHQRQLEALGPSTQDLRSRIAALGPRLKSGIDAARAAMEAHALNVLGAEKQLSERYLVEAHFALARLYDRPADEHAASGAAP